MSELISTADWEARKQFVRFSDEDLEAISWISPMAEFFAGEVIEMLYGHLLSHEQSKVHLQDEALTERLKIAQSEYFIQLFAGEYGEAYLKTRLAIGRVHYQVGLPLSVYMSTYSMYYMLIRPHIFEYIDDEDDAFMVLDALAKLITLDETVAVDAYVDAMKQDLAG